MPEGRDTRRLFQRRQRIRQPLTETYTGPYEDSDEEYRRAQLKAVEEKHGIAYKLTAEHVADKGKYERQPIKERVGREIVRTPGRAVGIFGGLLYPSGYGPTM